MNFYAEKTTSTVYPGALFKNPWIAQIFETISFEEGIGNSVGAPFIESPLYGYYQLGLKQGTKPC